MSAQAELVDFIHAITFRIWEQRGVERIRDYYAKEVVVYALTGIVDGAEAMVANTYQTLTSFPDRLLLAENVIASGSLSQGHSSHRILSPMTNSGATLWGPATGRKVVVRTIADCLVEDGRITREWLVRDTFSLVKQLGFENLAVARVLADTLSANTRTWLAEEIQRTRLEQDVAHDLAAPCRALLQAWLCSADASVLEATHTPYAILWPDSLEVCSGWEQISAYFQPLRRAFPNGRLAIDQVAGQPWAGAGMEIAVRFSFTACHEGIFEEICPTRRDVYMLGVVHLRQIHGKVTAAWLLMDRLGLMAQLV